MPYITIVVSSEFCAYYPSITVIYFSPGLSSIPLHSAVGYRATVKFVYCQCNSGPL